MTTYTLTTGGDDGLTDEMVRGLISERRNASPRLARLLVQLEWQLPRTLEVGDTCHAKKRSYPRFDRMTVKGIDGDIIWVLDAGGDRHDWPSSSLAFGPRPS